MHQIMRSVSATQNGSSRNNNNSNDNNSDIGIGISIANHQLDQIGATTATANQASSNLPSRSSSSSNEIANLISLARVGYANRKQWANADAAAFAAALSNSSYLHRDRGPVRRKQHYQRQQRRGGSSISRSRSRSRRRKNTRAKSNQRRH